jgi:aminopeptidase-like protein
LEFVHPHKLGEALMVSLEILAVLENNGTFVNVNPKCEPQLGKRGMYRMVGGAADAGVSELAMLWVLNQSDGKSSLLDIAERSGMSFHAIRGAAEALQEHQLLRRDFKSVPQAAR